jgi:nitrogen fixation NifU-like protein
MDALQQMYQQVILEHAKKPHGRIPGDPATSDLQGAVSHQVNPTCGDEITLQVELQGGKVHNVTWQGQGCSISQASASVMTDLVLNNSVDNAQELDQLFHELMNSRGKGLADAAEEQLEDAVAFTGTSLYPARIKCALLGWAALKDALSKTEIDS